MGIFKGIVFKAEGFGVLIMLIGFGLAWWKRTEKGKRFYKEKIEPIPMGGKFLTFYMDWPLGILGFLMAFPDMWNDIWNWALGTLVLIGIYLYRGMRKAKREAAAKKAKENTSEGEKATA